MDLGIKSEVGGVHGFLFEALSGLFQWRYRVDEITRMFGE